MGRSLLHKGGIFRSSRRRVITGAVTAVGAAWGAWPGAWLSDAKAGAAEMVSKSEAIGQGERSLVRVVNVRAFGAKADGISNDAPAFNSAIQHIRERQHQIGGYDVCSKLLIPCGVYSANEPIDMTQIRAINAVIEGDGSVILGRCFGAPVIDALGSRWLTMKDLTIIGDMTAPPKLGMQIGLLKNQTVADDHRFENVKIVGSFTLACLLNLGAETSEFNKLLLWNSFPHGRSYCLIQDGLDHFSAASSFVPKQRAIAERDTSFNENMFLNCDFRHTGGGVPVWLGDTSRHRFIRCYSATRGEAAFVIYCGANGHTMLDIDCHCEATGLKSIFLFDGTAVNPVIQGFSYFDHVTYAAEAVFQREPHLGKVTLHDADIRVARYFIESCKVFDNTEHWIVTGRYSSQNDSQWNGEGLFTGLLFLGKQVMFSPNMGLRVTSGDTAHRPSGLGPADEGYLFRDRVLKKLIVWSGVEWTDAEGRRV